LFLSAFIYGNVKLKWTKARDEGSEYVVLQMKVSAPSALVKKPNLLKIILNVKKLSNINLMLGAQEDKFKIRVQISIGSTSRPLAYQLNALLTRPMPQLEMYAFFLHAIKSQS
jgi:hypothetical protein